MPADGSLFGVSPDTQGFVIHPSGANQQLPGATLPLPLALDYVSDPFSGSLIAFSQCPAIPGSDGPMTLPVYAMPTGASLVTGQSLVPTVLASGMSPRPVQWSTGMDRSNDATREGPLMQLLLQWIRKIALWSRRVYRAVRTGSRLIPGRQSLT